MSCVQVETKPNVAYYDGGQSSHLAGCPAPSSVGEPSVTPEDTHPDEVGVCAPGVEDGVDPSDV